MGVSDWDCACSLATCRAADRELLLHLFSHEKFLDFSRDCHRERVDKAHIPRNFIVGDLIGQYAYISSASATSCTLGCR
jgi:hypothetical protein